MPAEQPHRRIRFLVIITLAMMVIFVMRLFYMQIIQHDKYTALASKEQVKSLTIFAKRGEIYAMDGTTPVQMVLNQTVYTVFVDPVEVQNPDAIVSAVHDIAGGTAVKDIGSLVRAKPMRYEIVAKNVSRKQAELLSAKHLAGLGLQQTTQRVYPEGKLAAQVLGFVNSEGKGQYGVEEKLDSELRGQDGLRKAVTDISNVPLTIGKENTEIPAKDGENVVLTIDRNIQAYTEKALELGLKKAGASNGSAIVLDPQTGKVLAMANMPTYNPGNYTAVQNAAAFNNGTITTPYEPGSVMKTFTAAMGINEGRITPQSTYDNTDHIKIDGWDIGNATLGQTGTITIQHALNWSLNTGFVTVAQRLGNGHEITLGARQTMYDYLHNKFRLGQDTGIQLAGEQPGEIIPPTQPEGNAIRYANMSFGQGMNITMLQVAAGFSAIVNGGVYHSPMIVAGQVDNDEFKKAAQGSGTRILTEATSKTTKKMIHDARAAFYAADDKPGYDIGGKTGTAQTLINGSYDNNQTIASYLGYGGDTKPRYVIMVQVSSPGKTFEGNRDAMPIFTDISNWMIDYDQLQPRG